MYSESLKISAFDWEVEDLKGENENVQIRCWGVTEPTHPEFPNTSVLVRIETFKPFIYYELPNNGSWTADDAEEIHSTLRRALGRDHGECLTDFNPKQHFVNYRTLYYYQPDPRPMIYFSFSNLESMRHAGNILRKGIYYDDERLTDGRVLLAEIDPVLKMLVDRDITHSCWFTINVKKLTKEVEKIFRLSRHEYLGDWKSIKRAEGPPPKLKFVSYDIEQYSSNPKCFPREWKASDVVFMIGCVFFTPGEAKRVRYCILMGDMEYRPKNGREYQVIRVKTEDEVILKFCELIREHDVDVITGYNIAQFDNGRIDSRLKICNKKWPEIGRLKNYKGLVNRISWGSSAYGEKNIKKLYMPGRIMMDYFEETRRTQKWDSYTLDNAAKEILNDKSKGKHDVKPEEMFAAFKAMKKYLNRADCEERRIAFRAMGRVANYCVQDCEVVVDMIEKTNWDIASVEMSNVVGVTMQEMYLGGQQRRCLSLLYREAYKDPKNRIILDVRAHENFFYEGGKVQDPVRGLTELALTLDFKSLYPSIMIRHNLGHDTLIHPDDHDKYNENQVQIAKVMTSIKPMEDDLDMDEKKLKKLPKEERTFMFINREIYKGISPRIVDGLIRKRGEVRGAQKAHKEGSFEWTVLELRQLAYKVSANSMYGFFGVRVGGKRPCLEVAATVTYFGRRSITHTIEKILEKYPGTRLIYGDTDSCMVKVPGVTLETAWAKTKELAAYATSLFEKPLELEGEWPADIFCVRMKNYAKYKVNEKTNDWFRDENGDRKLEVKGMMPTRRDTCEWAKDVCVGILKLIMEKYGYCRCVQYLAKNVLELYDGQVEIDDLVISKKMGSGYSSDTATMKVFGDEMARLGKPINAGERHKYLVLDRPGMTKIGQKMMLLQAFESGEISDPIDFSYYYTNLLMKKIDIIMDAEYGKYKEQLSELEFKIRNTKANAAKPAKYIAALIKRGNIEGGNEEERSMLRRKKVSNFLSVVKREFSHIGVN